MSKGKPCNFEKISKHLSNHFITNVFKRFSWTNSFDLRQRVPLTARPQHFHYRFVFSVVSSSETQDLQSAGEPLDNEALIFFSSQPLPVEHRRGIIIGYNVMNVTIIQRDVISNVTLNASQTSLVINGKQRALKIKEWPFSLILSHKYKHISAKKTLYRDFAKTELVLRCFKK